jgi:hypothetical protein
VAARSQSLNAMLLRVSMQMDVEVKEGGRPGTGHVESSGKGGDEDPDGATDREPVG